MRHAWVNDITTNGDGHREIPHLLPELFLYSHMISGSLLSGKIKSSQKGIEEIYFRKGRTEQQFRRFDNKRVDLKFCDLKIMSVNVCTA